MSRERKNEVEKMWKKIKKKRKKMKKGKRKQRKSTLGKSMKKERIGKCGQ